MLQRFIIDFDQNGNIVSQQEVPISAPPVRMISLPPPPPPFDDYEKAHDENDLPVVNLVEAGHDILPQPWPS